MSSREVQQLVSEITRSLPLHAASLGSEYFYQHLPLCIIDAVFSIGVRYTSTTNTVRRFCCFYNLTQNRPCLHYPPTASQLSVREFCNLPEQQDPHTMASIVYRNCQRTSARSGILKAEAVLRFGQCLVNHGVNYFQDLQKVVNSHGFEQAIRAIPGQRSGVSLHYFWMLAGNDQLIKPDRMVLRFLSSALGREVRIAEAQSLLAESAKVLQQNYPSLTPRLLDHEIWKYQRAHDRA